jgi:transposase
MQRRARQAPAVADRVPEPIRLTGLPALTDTQWELLRPLLPPQKPRTGRPATDHRQVVEGMLWVVRTGSSWRELPERFGPWSTVASRYQRWCKTGIWVQILRVLQAHETPISSSA